jgi:hypothetical protein
MMVLVLVATLLDQYNQVVVNLPEILVSMATLKDERNQVFAMVVFPLLYVNLCMEILAAMLLLDSQPVKG